MLQTRHVMSVTYSISHTNKRVHLFNGFDKLKTITLQKNGTRWNAYTDLILHSIKLATKMKEFVPHRSCIIINVSEYTITEHTHRFLDIYAHEYGLQLTLHQHHNKEDNPAFKILALGAAPDSRKLGKDHG